MERFTTRLSVCVLTFIVGVTFVMLWVSKRSQDSGKPLRETVAPAAPFTPLCAVLQSPALYEHKTIRTRVTLVGYHVLVLSDPGCLGEKNFVRAETDAKTREQLIAGIDALGGVGVRDGNFLATVELVGEFEEIPAMKGAGGRKSYGGSQERIIEYTHRLVVSDVIEVRAAPADSQVMSK